MALLLRRHCKFPTLFTVLLDKIFVQVYDDLKHILVAMLNAYV